MSGVHFKQFSATIRKYSRALRCGLGKQSIVAPGIAIALFQPLPQASFASDENNQGLQEIVVTAQKREERLIDVPIPVSVIDGDALAQNNFVKLTDYYTEVPGLNVAPGVLGTTNLVIRGITAGTLTSSTVGIMVDGVPVGATGAQQIPDIDPGDLARVEVLRGPQGTLFGVSSMGGLINFVTRDPSGDHVEGRVQADTEQVKNGADLGYTFRGSITAPVADGLWVNASGFTRRDAGYIDDPLTGAQGINQAYASGGRVGLNWRPNDVYSLKLSALYQTSRADSVDGFVILDQGLRDLQANTVKNGEAYDRDVQIYSAIFSANYGSVRFQSNTGYNVLSIHGSDDSSFANNVDSEAVWGVAGAPSLANTKSAKVSQEFRLNFPMSHFFDGLFGLFFDHETDLSGQTLIGTDPITGKFYGVGYYNEGPSHNSEYAAFGNVTAHVLENFDIQGGARWAKIRSDADGSYIYGEYVPLPDWYGQAPPVFAPGSSQESTAVTYLVTPQYKITPNEMVYFRFSTGFRPGGSNGNTPGAPPAYNPDQTKDYELGAKAEYLSGRLTIDASIYRINWVDIQLTETIGTFIFTGNGGAARSQGVDVAIATKPMKGLNISAWASWNNAINTELPANLASFSPLSGTLGQVLPYAPRFSGNVSVTQDIVLTDTVAGYVGGEVAYIGDRKAEFKNPFLSQRQDLPAYAKVDFKLGARFQTWDAHFYLNNATDRRGLISAAYIPPDGYYIIRPRTLGLSVAKRF